MRKILPTTGCIRSHIAFAWGFRTPIGAFLIPLCRSIAWKFSPINLVPWSWIARTGRGYLKSHPTSNTVAAACAVVFRTGTILVRLVTVSIIVSAWNFNILLPGYIGISHDPIVSIAISYHGASQQPHVWSWNLKVSWKACIQANATVSSEFGGNVFSWFWFQVGWLEPDALWPTLYSYLATEKTTYIITKKQMHQHIKSLHNGRVNKNGKSIS